MALTAKRSRRLASVLAILFALTFSAPVFGHDLSVASDRLGEPIVRDLPADPDQVDGVQINGVEWTIRLLGVEWT